MIVIGIVEDGPRDRHGRYEYGKLGITQNKLLERRTAAGATLALNAELWFLLRRFFASAPIKNAANRSSSTTYQAFSFLMLVP